MSEPAIVGRIADGQVLFDLRTILPEDDMLLAERISDAYTALHQPQSALHEISEDRA